MSMDNGLVLESNGADLTDMRGLWLWESVSKEAGLVAINLQSGCYALARSGIVAVSGSGTA